jgi:hypothetical protein
VTHELTKSIKNGRRQTQTCKIGININTTAIKTYLDFEVFGEKAQNPSDAEIDFFIAVK